MDRVKGLVIPGGLVHAHIHLDKCYLLEKTPVGDGSFQEALQQTAQAKASFTVSDLVGRGSRLITASLQQGVLVMRAFVEVDPTVGLKCLEAGLELRRRYSDRCHLQLAIFAQDPLLYPDDPAKQVEMSDLLKQACEMTGGDQTEAAVIASTPYVEEDMEGQMANVKAMFDLAHRHDRQLDFHLDYNIDPDTKPLIWFVLEEAHRRGWKRSITIGHATRLSLFDAHQWDILARLCQGLNVAFVALPSSDLYMQGRAEPYRSRIRATLPLLELQARGIPCALAVNNVANLFTPQGNCDPLALLPLMVGLWQSATPSSLRALLSMVSSSALKTIHAVKGSDDAAGPQVAELLLSADRSATLDIDVGTDDFTLLVDCHSIQDAVLCPSPARMTVKDGKLVAWTRVLVGPSTLPAID